MGRYLLLVLALLVLGCDVQTGKTRLIARQPVEDAPADAREVTPGQYVKTIERQASADRIESLPVFGYAETINPQSPRDSVTSLEEGRTGAIPLGLRPIFAGARVGETRRLWNCSANRSTCLVSEYKFYRQPQ